MGLLHNLKKIAIVEENVFNRNDYWINFHLYVRIFSIWLAEINHYNNFYIRNLDSSKKVFYCEFMTLLFVKWQIANVKKRIDNVKFALVQQIFETEEKFCNINYIHWRKDIGILVQYHNWSYIQLNYSKNSIQQLT